MILRKVKTRDYTVVDNACIIDKGLSFKALGLLVYLLSRPDNWNFNYRHLSTTHTDGNAAVMSAMRELQERGYIRRRKVKNDDGTFTWHFDVFEERQEFAPPCSTFPSTDFPSTENRDLVSTEGASTEEAMSLTLVSEERAPTPAAIDAEFDRWWGVWCPNRRVSKAEARREYRNARKDTEAQVLYDGAVAYARLTKQQGTEPRHIVHPNRWLKNRRWEDEVPAEPNPFEAPTPMRFG